jgi:hypothetical protein
MIPFRKWGQKMRASTLISEILKGCGVSEDAAREMQEEAEKLIVERNEEIFVEVNGTTDFYIENVYVDGKSDICIAIKVKRGEIEFAE